MKTPDLPYDTMFQLVERHFSVLRDIQNNYLTIFTEQGLADFVKNGVLQDLPPTYVPPLESSDIKLILTKLYNELEKGTITCLIVRPTILQIPLPVHLYKFTDWSAYVYHKFFCFWCICLRYTYF